MVVKRQKIDQLPKAALGKVLPDGCSEFGLNERARKYTQQPLATPHYVLNLHHLPLGGNHRDQPQLALYFQKSANGIFKVGPVMNALTLKNYWVEIPGKKPFEIEYIELKRSHFMPFSSISIII